MGTENLYPDAILQSEGFTGGSVTDIDDDPDSPDGAWLNVGGANNVATLARVSFPTPTGTLDTAAGAQEFRVLLRKTNHSSDPDVTVFLYENGTQVATVVSFTAVSSTTGTVFSGTWSASAISNPANVECLVDFDVGGGSPGNRASGEIGAIEWVATTTTGGGSTNANAGNAALTVIANNSTTEIDASGQNSPVTITANNPKSAVDSSATTTDVTVSANNATVTTEGGGTSANSEEITVTVSALQPSVFIGTKAQIP